MVRSWWIVGEGVSFRKSNTYIHFNFTLTVVQLLTVIVKGGVPVPRAAAPIWYHRCRPRHSAPMARLYHTGIVDVRVMMMTFMVGGWWRSGPSAC